MKESKLPLALAFVAALAGCDDRSDSAHGNRSNALSAVDAPLELAPDLCDDPSKIAFVLGSLLRGGGAPSFGKPNPAQFLRMLAAPTKGPFYMVNLIRFRDRAMYADGRKTDLTGREADALYAETQIWQRAPETLGEPFTPALDMAPVGGPGRGPSHGHDVG